jgi:hypothetical protein
MQTPQQLFNSVAQSIVALMTCAFANEVNPSEFRDDFWPL